MPEETVLTDPTGLHLCAGPYLLLYSKHLSEEELHAPVVWPKVFTVRANIFSLIIQLIITQNRIQSKKTTKSSYLSCLQNWLGKRKYQLL